MQSSLAGNDRNPVADEPVLVVDDDEGIRKTIELALELGAHPVALANDGIDALEWLRAHDLPCLILLDLMMPRMDGWHLLEELQRDERLAHVPVVIMTAFGRELGRAAQLPVLRKPIELDTLLDVVSRYRRQEHEGRCSG